MMIITKNEGSENFRKMPLLFIEPTLRGLLIVRKCVLIPKNPDWMYTFFHAVLS